MPRGYVRVRIVVAAFLGATLVAAGCLIMSLPDGSTGGSGGSTGGSGGSGSGGSGGGGGGSTPPPTPSGPALTLANQSSKNLSLSFRVDAGTLQTISLNAGQSFVVQNLAACDCVSLDNFTPPGATQVEGFSVEACSGVTVPFSNRTDGSGGVSYSLSGVPSASALVTFSLSNTSSQTLTIFPFINGQVRPSFSLVPNQTQSITVGRCERLRVLARSPTGSFADVEFIEVPATTGAVYRYRDGTGSQVIVEKQL